MPTPKRYKFADGRTSWRVHIRVHGSHTTETFDTQAEALKFARTVEAVGAAEAVRLLQADNDADVPTLDEVAADHIRLKTGITDGTRLKDQRIWELAWAPHIGHLPANIDPSALRDAIAEATNANAEHYAHKTLQNQRGVLSGVVDRAVWKGYLTRRPWDRYHKLRLPEGRAMVEGEDEEREMVCLTYADWDALHDKIRPHYRPFTRFLVGTGARWGEVVVLRRTDFDLEAAQPFVRIRRALKWSPDGRRVIGVTKTPKSKRTVTLPPEVVADVRPLLEGKKKYDLVFTAPRGGMIAHRTFWSDHWRPAVFRAQQCDEHTEPDCRCGTAHPKRCKVHPGDELPQPCGCPGTLSQTPRIHDLRHTHVSWLLAIGIRVEVVSARIGHGSVKVTWDVYTHLLPDAQLQAAQAASVAFARGLPELEA